MGDAARPNICKYAGDAEELEKLECGYHAVVMAYYCAWQDLSKLLKNDLRSLASEYQFALFVEINCDWWTEICAKMDISQIPVVSVLKRENIEDSFAEVGKLVGNDVLELKKMLSDLLSPQI